ncbi:hypothetical protein DPMN_173436 [Dreissena polymorpha]|uniref:Uncharacterized protein n=1 Tax=Dreissena polymorpha TaxID=45954 RepID=A0A9D4IE74_DREPO|nr:hypothetical protein DPMN_173436 [Dreissena polymorpha]
MADIRTYMTHHQEAMFKFDSCGHQTNRRDQYDDHMAMHLRATNHVVEVRAARACYALANDSKEEEKDNFYKRLSTIIQDRPKRNILILMGDSNA